MVICGLRSLNSGEARYKSNSLSQSAAERGGRDPVTGFHSVILRLEGNQQDALNDGIGRPEDRTKQTKESSSDRTYPDSVNLVRPPNTTIPKTLAALPNSQ